jgi:hypothetical protein
MYISYMLAHHCSDGIMGMDIAKVSFWDQMYEAGKIRNKAFSLCFSRSPTASRQGTGAGAMSLGGSEERLHKTDMVYAKMENDGSSFYVVHVRKAYLRPGGGGDSALSSDPNITLVQLEVTEEVLNSGKFIVDSGTTDTYLYSGIAKSFKTKFRELTGTDFSSRPLQLTEEQLNSYPTILFQLTGNEDLNIAISERSKGVEVAGLAGNLDQDHPYDVILAIPPSHYFEYDEKEKTYTARIYLDEDRGSVLGANTMMGHDVLFDISSGSLGFADSDCDYETLLGNYYSGELSLSEEKAGTRDSETEANGDSKSDVDAIDGKTPFPEVPVYVQHEPNVFCAGSGCQAAAAFALVGAIVLLGWRLAHRSSSRRDPYKLSLAELEMQTTPSARDDENEHDADQDAFTHYESKVV